MSTGKRKITLPHLTLEDISDKWFEDNGYWRAHNASLSEKATEDYTIYVESESWRLLSDSCLRECAKSIVIDGVPYIKHVCVTPELLVKINNTGKLYREAKNYRNEFMKKLSKRKIREKNENV